MQDTADTAYLGLGSDVSEDEIPALELATDPRQRAAKQVNLESYWANFGGLDGRYVLLVGTKMRSLDRSILMVRLQDIADRTESRLDEAGLRGSRCHHVEWHEDV